MSIKLINSRQALGLLLTVSLLLPTVSLAGKKPENLEPCWFTQPVTTGRIGVIGVSRTLTADGSDPAKFSRYRALSGLARYLGTELDFKRHKIDLSQKEFLVGNQTVQLAEDYTEAGQIYSYAYLSDAPQLLSACSASKSNCSLEKCDPAWLCGTSSKSASLLGTSFRASDKTSQMRIASKNALSQLEPLYGLNVKAKDSYTFGQTSVGSVRVLRSQGSIQRYQNIEDADLDYIMTHRCANKEDLYVRVNIPELEAFSSPLPPKTWMRNPSSGQLNGAIGSVTGRVASGLLSDKIKLAVSRGLVALAKTHSAKLSSELLSVKRENGGYILTHIDQETEVTIRAQVNDIYFERNPKGIAVHAWIVEAEDDQQSL